MARRFSDLVEVLTDALASAWTFGIAVVVAVVGFVAIPQGDVREHFHLAIALFTFLLVFLLEHAEKRDTNAIHVKLNELLEAVEGARNEKIGVEELPGPDLERIARREREERSATPGRDIEEIDPREEERGRATSERATPRRGRA